MNKFRGLTEEKLPQCACSWLRPWVKVDQHGRTIRIQFTLKMRAYFIYLFIFFV